jgi:hypothetical protein
LSPGEVRKAEELANWEFIKSRDNIQDFRDHLARFPGGVTVRYVRERLEATAWAGLSTNAGFDDLKAYLVEFPEGVHAPEAQHRISELEREASANQELEERQRRETEAWAVASAAGDAASLRAFLNDWPNSPVAGVARSRIKELERVPTRRWVWQGAGVASVIVVGLLAWQFLFPLPLGQYRRSMMIIGAPDERISGSSIEVCRKICAAKSSCTAVDHRDFSCNLYSGRIGPALSTSGYNAWLR